MGNDTGPPSTEFSAAKEDELIGTFGDACRGRGLSGLLTPSHPLLPPTPSSGPGEIYACLVGVRGVGSEPEANYAIQEP